MMREYACSATVDNKPTTTSSPDDNQILVQSYCLDSKCNDGCMIHAFQTNKCLHTPFGSVRLTCTSDNVEEQLYSSRDCSGDSKKTSMPLHKCLNGYVGFFENVCYNNNDANQHYQTQDYIMNL